MLVLVVIQTLSIALLGLLVVSLLRSHAAILRRLHDAGFGWEESDDETPRPAPVPVSMRTREGVAAPGPGGAVPVDVVGTSPRGSSVSVSVSGSRPTLLAVLTSGCSTCEGFWHAFAQGVELPGDIRLVIVTKGDEAEDPAAVAALAPRGVVTVRSSSAWVDYAVPASPYFVLVGGGRVRGEGAALSWDQVSGLLERAVASAPAPGGARRRSGQRVQDTDDELLAAGLLPGDPSLHPGGEQAATVR